MASQLLAGVDGFGSPGQHARRSMGHRGPRAPETSGAPTLRYGSRARCFHGTEAKRGRERQNMSDQLPLAR